MTPRIYLSCDMEGTAGVAVWRQCDRLDTVEYPVYRRYMSQEVSAAIAGARDAGAGEVLVNDSHGSMVNLLWDELPSDVRLVSGSRKPFSMTQGLGGAFDAAIFTGYHARAGHADGVLAHTYNGSAIFEVRVNGRPCSEALLNAAVAGTYGIPVIMVSGDRALIDEIAEQMPWAVGVAVKDGIGNLSCDSLSPRAAQSALRSGAERAVRSIASARPFTFEAPFTFEVTTTQIEHADSIALMPDIERVDGRTVRFSHRDYISAYRLFVAALRLAAAAGMQA